MRSLVLLSLMATPALAAGNVTGDPAVFSDIGAGIVCAAGNRTRQPAPDTRAGFIELTDGPFSLGLATGRIPALPGLGFGVVASVAEAGGVEGVTVIVTHPPMGAGRNVRETWADDYLSGDTVANFFSFDLPEERVPGTWTIEAQKDGRVLYTARFEVVDPAAMPNFVNPCEGPPPVS